MSTGLPPIAGVPMLAPDAQWGETEKTMLAGILIIKVIFGVCLRDDRQR